MFCRYLSFFKYAFSGSAIALWKDYTIECPPAPQYCPFPNGDEVLKFFSIDKNNLNRDIGGLVALIIGWRIAAYFALVLVSRKKKID